MSELNNTTKKRSVRNTLMATASATSLVSMIVTPQTHASTTGDRPTVWIEVGGQLDRVGSQGESFTPPFAVLGAQHGLLPLGTLQSPPHYSLGEEGSISFQPNGSQWSFSASIQYGRANNQSYRHQEIPITIVLPDGRVQKMNGPSGFQLLYQTSDYTVKTNESHAVLDFAVGRDLGVGLWQNSLPGEISLGLRFAQFTAHTKMRLHADPYPHDAHYGSLFGYKKYLDQYYQFFKAQPEVARSFSGLGPTVSWTASIPLVGADRGDAEIELNIGANAGILFGRQKVSINHQTTGDYYQVRGEAFLTGGPRYVHHSYVDNARVARSRTAAVPNIGGLVGLSLNMPNGKLSLGYRADFFFGAMDEGIDVHQLENRNFYGPFATISIGL